MKRVIVFAGFLFCTLFSIAQQQFIIKGVLKGAPDKTEVTLHFDNPQNEAIAKAYVLNEQFVLKGSIAEPALYVLSTPVSKQNLGIFLEPAEVTVTAHKDSIMKGVVKGSGLHDAFVKFRSEFDPFFLKLDQLGKQISNPSNSSKQDSLYNLVRILITELDAKAESYIENNTQSAVTPLLLYILYSFFQQPAVLDTRFSKLTEPAQKSYYGRMVGEIVKENKIGAIGTQAIDFKQADPDGNMISLSSFKGKYVLVDFWASWCGPCRIENPNVVAAYNKFSNKNFTVFGVSLDQNKDKWLEAIARDGLTWTQVSDLNGWSNEAAKLYRISAIPRNFLIDPNGMIIAKDLRGDALTATLNEIFKSN